MFVPTGVNSAMMTPFNNDGSVNETVVRDWVDFMIEKGINGLFPISSIGEFVSIPLQEQYRFMEIVLEQAAGRVPVFPGTGAVATDISIKLAKHAEKIGCQAVVAMPPYYSPTSQDLVYKHFEKVAGSVNISVILYNIPMCTTPISLETMNKIFSIDNIVAIKDSSADMKNLMHLIDLAHEHGRDDFHVLTGWDDMLYPSLCAGAAGCITGVSGVLPEIIVPIYLEFKAGNYAKSLKLQREVLPVLRTMASIQFPAGYKSALDLRGFDAGPLRQPIIEVDETHYIKVRATLENQMGKLLGENLVVRKK